MSSLFTAWIKGVIHYNAVSVSQHQCRPNQFHLNSECFKSKTTVLVLLSLWRARSTFSPEASLRAGDFGIIFSLQLRSLHIISKPALNIRCSVWISDPRLGRPQTLSDFLHLALALPQIRPMFPTPYKFRSPQWWNAPTPPRKPNRHFGKGCESIPRARQAEETQTSLVSTSSNERGTMQSQSRPFEVYFLYSVPFRWHSHFNLKSSHVSTLLQ